MSESKKLNRLNINKETITDLDVPKEQDVIGGAIGGGASTSPAACIPPPTYLQGRTCQSERPNTCDWKLARA
jgi:hypothetical protein